MGSILLLIFMAVVATAFEKKYLKTYMSPATVFSWPYVITIIISRTIGELHGFPSIDDGNIFLICLGLFCFIFGEIFFLTVTHSNNRSYKIKTVEFSERFLRSAFKYVLFVVTVAAFKYIYVFARMGIRKYIVLDGGDSAVASGLTIHLMLSIFPLVPVLFEKAIYQKDKKIFITLLLFMLEVFFTYTKYHIIFLVIATLIYMVVTHPHTITYMLIAAVVLPTALFAINYLINFRARSVGMTSDYLIGHFLNYLLGGINYTSISDGMKNSTTITEIIMSFFTPLLNLIIRPVFNVTVFPNVKVPLISVSALGERGNVINFISFVFCTENYFAGAVFFFAFGIIVSAIVGSGKSNPMLKVYVSAVLVLGFYSSYLQLIIPWEVFVWCFVVYKLSKIRCIWKEK